MASFHQLYSTYTLQTYHHQDHQFRSWSMQITSPSHLHTQTCVQPRHTYNHTYIKFCLDKTKQSHTKSRQNNLHSVHSRPCRIYEQSGPKNKQHCTMHGNAPKGSEPYLRPKNEDLTCIYGMKISLAATVCQLYRILWQLDYHMRIFQITRVYFISIITPYSLKKCFDI